jgi:amidase
MSELCLEPAHRLIDLLRSRKVSSLDLLEQHAARLAARNPALNAVIATNLDAARARAREADAALARNESWGPLHGLPMTIKDSLEVTGMPTTCGAPALKTYLARHNAPAVQRLVDAGAIVFGKTNTPMYASDVQSFNKVYGTSNNPWNGARTPGGSSGGAAAALAAGLTPLELGSDLAGSIRTPAHFCGVYGHKPSYGLVPQRGHIPGPPGTLSDPDLAVVGPMARSAEDLALMLPILAGAIPPESSAWRSELPPPRRGALREYRVHAWLDDASCRVDENVRAVLEPALDKLRAQGCAVQAGAPAGVSLAELYEVYFALLGAMVAAGLPAKVFRRARIYGTVARWLGRDRVNTLAGFLRSTTVSHRDWLKLNEKRERLKAQLDALFADCDVLLLPVTRTTAPPHTQQGDPYSRTLTVNGKPEAYTSQFNWIAPATLGGLPATSAPAGLAADGLPVGIQIVSAFGQDRTTIDFARLLGGVVGGYRPPPQ